MDGLKPSAEKGVCHPVLALAFGEQQASQALGMNTGTISSGGAGSGFGSEFNGGAGTSAYSDGYQKNPYMSTYEEDSAGYSGGAEENPNSSYYDSNNYGE